MMTGPLSAPDQRVRRRVAPSRRALGGLGAGRTSRQTGGQTAVKEEEANRWVECRACLSIGFFSLSTLSYRCRAGLCIVYFCSVSFYWKVLSGERVCVAEW